MEVVYCLTYCLILCVSLMTHTRGMPYLRGTEVSPTMNSSSRRPTDRRRHRGKGMVGPKPRGFGCGEARTRKRHHAADLLITLYQLAPTSSTSSLTRARQNLASNPKCPKPRTIVRPGSRHPSPSPLGCIVCPPGQVAECGIKPGHPGSCHRSSPVPYVIIILKK